MRWTFVVQGINGDTLAAALARHHETSFGWMVPVMPMRSVWMMITGV
jgi:hypothetical protein